jgi:phosphatidylglycerol:prolipoprotein diacylglycerol transferase
VTDAAYLHDLSPVAFSLAGFPLRWYGLSYALGFILAWLLLRAASSRGVTPLSPQRLTDAMLALILGVVVGGRLGYCLFYEPSLLWTFHHAAPWWGLLEINRGGMASHGGMIGVLVASFFIARGPRDPSGLRPQRVPVLHVFDLVAFVSTLGLGLGRLANFINGELLGRVVAPPGQPAPWWSVRFPQEILSGHRPALSPDQTARLDTIVSAYTPVGGSFDDGFDRLLRALQHASGPEHARLAAELAPLLAARHPSQLYQAFAEGLLLTLLLWLLWLTPKKPGVIASSFLIFYGVLRIATEHWRLPDAHLATQLVLGLSRGQWLSVGMILAGAAMLAMALRATSPRMGGWLRRAAP